jgi:hypothetical protein
MNEFTIATVPYARGFITRAQLELHGGVPGLDNRIGQYTARKSPAVYSLPPVCSTTPPTCPPRTATAMASEP